MDAGGDADLAIPEWKRLLLMRKRAGHPPPPDEPAHPPPTNGAHPPLTNGAHPPLTNGAHPPPTNGATPPRTVTRTIGRLHVELRSVADSPDFSFSTDGSSPRASGSSCEEEADLPYGPGIVDRLRARFLSMGADRRCRKPVVRRFSSLENLPGSHASGPLRGLRQNGRCNVFGGQPQGPVKKAQSMEALPSGRGPERPAAVRRAGHVRGVEGRNGWRVADENDAPDPEVPKRSRDYRRSASAPSIREDELPRPDTVKQVKKMFESPDRFRKGESPVVAARRSPPTEVQVETHDIEEVSEEDSETAKLTGAEGGAEDGADSDLASDGTEDEPPPYRPVDEETAGDLSPANGGARTLASGGGAEREESFVDVREAAKVTPERLPFAERQTPEEVEVEPVSLQPRQELGREGGEEQPTLVADIPPDDLGERAMVVVASSAAFQKPWAAKKAPQPTTSVVFDFRGKDVKPNVSLNPTPFGCRPAKVSRRAGSPAEGLDGDAPDDLDDWDETDVGADLPAVCGIAFHGENVKVGRGALLQTRNKELTIQFDDGATSTFEYPSELDSPPDENGLTSPPAIAMDSPANARLGLSNYTPHVLSSDEDFELGVSRPSQRPMKPLPKVPMEEEATTPDDIVPAEEAAVWSSAETTDILF